MESGNVNQFLESITWQEEAVLFNGHKYFFNPHGSGEQAVLEIQQWNLRDEWELDFYRTTGVTSGECVKKMVGEPIWNGKTFWEAESEMRWIEW